MALRKPLVQVNGQIQQLQAGDDLDATMPNQETMSLTNDEAGSIVIGMAVYLDADDGVKKARANATGTSKVIGLVTNASVSTGNPADVLTDGILVATTGQWDAVTGLTGGLNFGTVYYLSEATAGHLTETAPTSVGDLICPVGIAISTTELRVEIGQTILL